MSSQLHRIRFGREPSNGEDTIVVEAPRVTGTATQGQTLTCSTPVVRGLPTGTTFTRQWYRDKTLIAGATSATYVLQAADVGKRVACVVSVVSTRVPTKVFTTRPTAIVT